MFAVYTFQTSTDFMLYKPMTIKRDDWCWFAAQRLTFLSLLCSSSYVVLYFSYTAAHSEAAVQVLCIIILKLLGVLFFFIMNVKPCLSLIPHSCDDYSCYSHVFYFTTSTVFILSVFHSFIICVTSSFSIKTKSVWSPFIRPALVCSHLVSSS